MNQAGSEASRLLQQSGEVITVFTLSWCAYCHAVKKLLSDLKVPYSVIELDTGDYRPAERHNRLRHELRLMTGSQTLPQVFVGDTPVGGYTDTQAALRSGRLKTLLAQHQIHLP